MNNLDLNEWAVVLRKAAVIFPSNARVLHVDTFPRKKDGYYRTIADALANAKPLDRILIHHGEYQEDIYCKKSVSIEAADPDVVIMSSKRPCLMVSCSGGSIFVKGIKFLQQGTGDVDGVSLRKGNLHLENCIIESRGANCVSVNSDSHLSLTGCKVQNGKQYGINICEDSTCLLENNVVANNGWDGIMIMGNSEAVIRGTSIMENGYNGVSINTKRRVNVEHSHISDNIWDGITIKNPKSQCVLYNNKIYSNKGFGIYFEIQINKKKKKDDDLANLMDCENSVYENKKGSRNFDQTQ
jgi:parallel beta-helix repeat protein